MLRLSHPQSRLGHVVAVLHRVRQLRAATGQACAHFLHQHVQGGVIDQDMVQQQDADEAVLLRGVSKVHQRGAGQVEAIVAWVEALLQLRQGITPLHVDALNRQRRLAQDHLYRFIQAFPEQAGAQDVVAGYDAVQCTDKRIQRCLVGKAELHLQHIGIALGGCQVVIKNTGLQRRQAVDVLHVGDTAGHGAQDMVDAGLVQRHQGQHVRGDVFAGGLDQVDRHLYVPLPTHRSRQGRQRGLTEQHAHISTQVHLAHAFDQLDRQQGVAAEFKEVVVAPHPVELQQLLPDTGDGGFNRALRGGIVTPREGIGIRCRQGLAVELAVGGQRQLIQQHEGAGHHVFGQAQQQVVAQCGGANVVLANHIGDQAFVTRLVLTGDHHGVTHAVGGGQACFDFTQFDTKTANLHLVIVAAQVLDAAIGQQAAEVAGLVHAQAGGRVGQEAFGVERITVEVTARHTGAADVQLASHAKRQRLALLVQHVELQVGNTHANRAHADQLRIRRFQRAISDVHRGFGDAVHIDQLRSGVDRAAVPRLEHAGLQRFAAENHLAKGVRLRVAALCGDQLPEGTRRLVEYAHAGFAEQRVALIRRAADQLWHDQQLATVHQRAPDFPHGEVERKGMKQCPHIVRVEAEPLLGGREQPRHLAMLDHYAFGQAGGT